MLITELKILAKVLADRLQIVLSSLIGPEQTCAVKGRTIQDNLHLVRLIIEKVDSDAALINLDQSKAFDRVDHRFLEAVLSAAGFGPHFRTWIRLLYASPGALVEVNGVRSKPFMLSRSFRQGCPLSPLLYALALEPFLRKLKTNPVLRGISLPGATTSARYFAYADDVSVLVSICWLAVGFVEGSFSSRIFPLDGRAGQDTRRLVRSRPPVEMNWSEVREKAELAVRLWTRRNLSLKGRTEVCASHIYPILLYRLSVLPLPSDTLLAFVRLLFSFLWGGKAAMVSREICYLHPSDGGLGVPCVETRQHTLRITYLDRMCMQLDEDGEFWKEDAGKHFPSLRNVRSCEEETGRTPRCEGSFYRECRISLKRLLRAKDGLSDVQPLSRITHLAGDSRSPLGRQRLRAAGLAKSPNCVRCSGEVETIGHAFFHCSVVVPLCKFVEDIMVRMLRGKFFVLEASSVCSNIVPPLTKAEHYVFICLLWVMRVVIWTTRQKEFHGREKFSSSQLILFFKHQLKVKIRTERKRLHPLEFGEIWVSLARLCRVKGADLEWHFDAG
ncbi:unnamed protein product [Acanthosepion pharaonis]|uniref:Reverse transcriptase domain-containing protein n=1 Tax=Acanthosepion pharaonis TaxID=158019 RepID=A0A812CIM9_ACAPH|nr:unnamed protein product [Sepia pharaonis]